MDDEIDEKCAKIHRIGIIFLGKELIRTLPFIKTVLNQMSDWMNNIAEFTQCITHNAFQIPSEIAVFRLGKIKRSQVRHSQSRPFHMY